MVISNEIIEHNEMSKVVVVDIGLETTNEKWKRTKRKTESLRKRNVRNASSVRQLEQIVQSRANDAANMRPGQYTKHKDASTITDYINI